MPLVRFNPETLANGGSRHAARRYGLRGFGRGRARLPEPVEQPAAFPVLSDLKLFTGTFIAGFLFVSMLIA